MLHDPTIINAEHWFAVDGDNTLLVSHPLTANSLVLDVGGYVGDWSAAIAERYGCRIHVFEPVRPFFVKLTDRFSGATNITCHNFGVSDKTHRAGIHLDANASSLYSHQGAAEEIGLVDIAEVFRMLDLRSVSLLKMNVEGAEFPILWRMFERDLLNRCKRLLIQFHTSYPDAISLREHIRSQLRKTHRLDWEFPFVWECWSVADGSGV